MGIKEILEKLDEKATHHRREARFCRERGLRLDAIVQHELQQAYEEAHRIVRNNK